MSEFTLYLKRGGVEVQGSLNTGFAIPLSKLDEAMKLSRKLETAIIGGYLCSREDLTRKCCSSWQCWFCDPKVGELDSEYLSRSQKAVEEFVSSLSDEEKSGAALYFLIHEKNNSRNYTHLNDDSRLFRHVDTYFFKTLDIEYSVVVDPNDPDHIKFDFGDEVEICPIDRKDWKREDINNICVGGMIWNRKPAGAETSWFEFEIGAEPSISYWTDRALIRKDVAIL